MLALRFYLGDRRFAAPARGLRAVLPAAELSPVAGGPFWLAGLLTLHGRAVPIVDLGLASGGEACPALYHTRILLVDLAHDRRAFTAGLMVERATDLAELPDAPRAEAGFSAGRLRLGAPCVEGRELLYRLDPAKLFPPEWVAEMAAFTGGAL